MDAALFTKMLSDKNVLDLRKLGYKFPQADIKEFTELLKNGFYHSLPLKDFSGQNIVYLSSIAQVRLSAAKVLLTPQNSTQLYGVKAMEEEIVSTFTIEQVDFTRDSVRKILSGLAPTDESENRIFGMKKGLEFISDPANQITEETIHQLYEMAIGAYLPEEDRLLPGHFYRHDSVYVIGAKVEHTGYTQDAVLRVRGCLYAHYTGPMSQSGLASQKLNIFAFENELELNGNVYTIFVNQDDDDAVVDVFMETK